MIELYTYPPTKEDLKKIVVDITNYFESNYKSEYSELPIVKKILKDIDDINFVRGKYVENDIDGYSIFEISNTAKMAIIFNVFPETEQFFLQEFMGSQAYNFLETIPKDKKVKLIGCLLFPSEAGDFPQNVFKLNSTGEILNTEDDFDFFILDSNTRLHHYFYNKAFYDSEGNKRNFKDLKENLIQQGILERGGFYDRD